MSGVVVEIPAEVAPEKFSQKQSATQGSAFSRRGDRNAKTSFARRSKNVDGSTTERREPDSEVDRVPWKAGYYTSIKTQRRIKDAASSPSRGGNRVGQSPTERASRVLRTFLTTPPERCNAANLVCALTTSAKLISSDTVNDDFRTLFFKTIDILEEMVDKKFLSARQLCNAAWAIAKHYDRDEHLLPKRRSQGATALSSDDVIGHAETWDLSVTGDEESRARTLDVVVDKVASDLTFLLEDDALSAKEGELCMASWAYGVLRPRVRPPGWKHGPQVAAAKRPRRRPAQEDAVSDVVTFETWSVLPDDEGDDVSPAEPSSPTDMLFDAIGVALLEPRADDTGTIGGLGANGVERCQWRELANLAWAFASHGRSCSLESQDLLVAIAREASRRLNDPAADAPLSRDISQIIWSLGILQSDTYQLADVFLEVVDALVTSNHLDTPEPTDDCRPFERWSCADIVQVALSLAHARVDERDLLRALYSEASRRFGHGPGNDRPRQEGSHRKSFHAWEVSILLWAQARLHLKSPQGLIFEKFASVAASYITEQARNVKTLSEIGIGSQEQANLVWSLTLLEEYKYPNVADLISRIFGEAAASCEADGLIHLEHAHQLWQALFLLEEECPDAVSNVPKWFYEYLHDKWQMEKARTKVSSARHRSLSQTLNLMGVAHWNEHDEDIDVAIVLKSDASWTHETTVGTVGEGVKIAVEFDGPNHFTRQRSSQGRSSSFSGGPSEDRPPPPRALGHTVLKYRILKKQGWTVVRVPVRKHSQQPESTGESFLQKSYSSVGLYTMQYFADRVFNMTFLSHLIYCITFIQYFEYDKIPFWASMERQRYLQRVLKTHGKIRFSEIDMSKYKAPVPDRRSRFD